MALLHSSSLRGDIEPYLGAQGLSQMPTAQKREPRDLGSARSVAQGRHTVDYLRCCLHNESWLM
jgi:hypothetical protein